MFKLAVLCCVVLPGVFAAVQDKFQQNDIVDDLSLGAAPANLLEVHYPNKEEVNLGNVLTPTQVQHVPEVKFAADADSYYTLMMIDPDAPSRAAPKYKAWQHWVVVNIPGSDVASGEALSEYVGSGPPKGSGLHRYVFLVYKQQAKAVFDERRLSKRNGSARGKFSVSNFVAKYNLGSPLFGNFYSAEWDEYVPELYKQLIE